MQQNRDIQISCADAKGNNSDVLMAVYDILFDFHFLPDARGFQQNITINITFLLIKTGNRTWIFYTDLMCHCFKHRTHFSRHLYSRGKKNPLSENSINWSTILVVFYFQLTTWQGITVLYFSQCEKSRITGIFLVRIFLYSDWIRRFIQSEYRKIWTRKNSVFGHFLCSK